MAQTVRTEPRVFATAVLTALPRSRGSSRAISLLVNGDLTFKDTVLEHSFERWWQGSSTRRFLDFAWCLLVLLLYFLVLRREDYNGGNLWLAGMYALAFLLGRFIVLALAVVLPNEKYGSQRQQLMVVHRILHVVHFAIYLHKSYLGNIPCLQAGAQVLGLVLCPFIYSLLLPQALTDHSIYNVITAMCAFAACVVPNGLCHKLGYCTAQPGPTDRHEWMYRLMRSSSMLVQGADATTSMAAPWRVPANESNPLWSTVPYPYPQAPTPLPIAAGCPMFMFLVCLIQIITTVVIVSGWEWYNRKAFLKAVAPRELHAALCKQLQHSWLPPVEWGTICGTPLLLFIAGVPAILAASSQGASYGSV